MLSRAIVLVAAFLLVACSFAQGGIGAQTTVDTSALTTNPSLKDVRIDQLQGAQVPLTSTFKEWDGSSVTMGNLVGQRPAILLCIFYQCTGVCAVELENLLTTLGKMKDFKLGTDYDIIVLSIDPKEGPKDAAEKRKEVLNTLTVPGSNKGWHFLSGTMPNIRAVTDAVGFRFTYDAAKDIVNHPSGIMFLSPNARVSSYIYGANYRREDITNNLLKASRNELGVKAKEIFFGCIHVDPITGKRSIAIMGVLRLFAFLTVAVLAISVLALSGRSFLRRKPTS